MTDLFRMSFYFRVRDLSKETDALCIMADRMNKIERALHHFLVATDSINYCGANLSYDCGSDIAFRLHVDEDANKPKFSLIISPDAEITAGYDQALLFVRDGDYVTLEVR